MVEYLVLGAGMQGTACVFDLIEHGGARAITWVDGDEDRLQAGLRRIAKRCEFAGLRGQVLDAGDERGLRPLFEQAQVCVNALPYRFAPEMTRLALESHAHYLDLGGNTAIVLEQLELHRGHPNGAELCVLPDCGLMPGMGNLFVAHAVSELGDLARCEVRCGGLPTDPKPPLGYKLVFSVAGLINEYFGRAHILRGGQVVEVETFGELERMSVEGLGEVEAFLTSGGLGTTPWTFAERIEELDYKTVRYPGHHAQIKTLLDLGLLSEDPIEIEGTSMIPRRLLHRLMEQHLDFPDDRDLVFLRTTAWPKGGGDPLVMELFDRPEQPGDFTAMERSTAYSATAVAAMIAEGKVEPGPGPLERAVPTAAYLDALRVRGLDVRIRTSP